MANNDAIRKLVSAALDTFDDDQKSVASITRSALRIAVLRQDPASEMWLRLHLIDYSTVDRTEKIDSPDLEAIGARLTSMIGADDAAKVAETALKKWQVSRTFNHSDGQRMLHSASLPELEKKLTELLAMKDGLRVPGNLSSFDTYRYSADIEAAKAKITESAFGLQSVMEKVRSSIFDYLIQTELQMDAGQDTADVFQRAQTYVNSRLNEIDPGLLQQFVSAQERLAQGDSEALSHALTTCRRIIKAIADYVYPPTSETVTGDDGVPRAMSDEHYRNRLIEYVKTTLSQSNHSQLIVGTIQSFGARLNALDQLASKGVHSSVSADEAASCVSWTYLLASEIMRIQDGSAGTAAAQS